MAKNSSTFRRFLALIIFLTLLFLLLFIFFATRSALDVWERLQALPPAVLYSYSAVIIAIILAGLWIIFRLLKPTPTIKQNEIQSKEDLITALDNAEQSGMSTGEIRQELERLEQRKATGSIHIALFGDISTGKSSVIKTLLPDATLDINAPDNAPDINVKGGSTQEIREYTWHSQSGDQLILTDLPGRNEADGELNTLAQEEAIRAHIVIYVTDSDLSRNQYQDILELQSFGKPLIIAFNKSDRFTDKEKTELRQRIESQLQATQNTNVLNKSTLITQSTQLVFIRSGGQEEVIKVYPDGREEAIVRDRNADVSALANSIQDEIDKQSELLSSLRDASVFVLVKQKLDDAQQNHRVQEAEKVIKSSTRKAVLGALASVSPGTDIVIQGVLGTQMVKSLCNLYDTPVKQLDIDKFLDFSQSQIKNSVPLLLAVAGNGMKAFPGIGTVTGGLTHAVAYGMIFDALGNAVHKTLQQRGSLKAAPAALIFKEMLTNNLENRAKLFAKLVYNETRQDKIKQGINKKNR